MAFTRLEKDMNIIQKLEDEPNDVGGLTSAQLKAKFDEGNNAMKEWINEVFIPEAEEALHEAWVESLPNHAVRHAADAVDPITPGMIGAVSKAGDIMAGALTVWSGWPCFRSHDTVSGRKADFYMTGNGANIMARNLMDDANTYRTLLVASPDLQNRNNALQLFEAANGQGNTFPVFHAGNKPSASYTGNGSTSLRAIGVGGIGDTLVIRSEEGVLCFVNAYGCYLISDGSVSFTEDAKFAGGMLTMETKAVGLNTGGITYNYRVL